MSSTKPGFPLSDDERISARIGDVIDQLESVQAIDPNQLIEDALDTLRFLRKTFMRRFDPETGRPL
jgi:hypothetical protein